MSANGLLWERACFESSGGRGPGSGVRFSPHALAMLLISLLATDSLSEVEDQTKLFADLKSVGGKCPLTGKKTFATAMAAILANDELMRRVAFIGADRVARHTEGTAKATIFYNDGVEGEKSRFGPRVDAKPKSLSVSASLMLPLELLWDLP